MGGKEKEQAGEIHLHAEHTAGENFGDESRKRCDFLGCHEELLADDRNQIIEHLCKEMQDGVHAIQEVLQGPQLDLLEVCAPWDSPLSRAVVEEGGRAMSIGVHNGYDLTTRMGFKRAVKLLRDKKPRYLHVSFPCDPWTPLQNLNQKTEEQREHLESKRNTHKKIIHRCRRLVEIQVQEFNGHCSCDVTARQHHAGVEQPLRASSWGLTEVREMVRLCGGTRFRVDGCRHGLRNPDTGRLFQKPWGWCSTHAGVRKALEMTCCHGRNEHDRVEGRYTARTAVYPYLLCRRFARALMKDLKEIYPLFEQHECDKDQVFIGDEDYSPDVFPNDPFEHEPPANASEPENSEPDLQPEPASQPDGENASEENQRDIMLKLKTIHRNLGHPCHDVLMRMLRDAGASSQMMDAARGFECSGCLQRGRRASTKPVSTTVVREKWHTISVDTFWWKYPESVVGKHEKNKHIVGISLMDEATDFHTAIVVREGFDGHMQNISASEFIKSISEGWLQRYPAPTILRYDEEGLFRSSQLKEFLENFGIKFEPIAGESAWQLGKHSRHLQTLKEQMNLLASELGRSFEPQQILALAVNAKNSLHNIRGYTPHQWAFGKSHGRIASFLQQHDCLPLQSSRQDLDFEEALQAEVQAQKLFLEADARRRLSRALRFRCRPLKEFSTGQLVYYFRKGRKEGSRYGGKWHGPARVLCHESTSVDENREHTGSIVWISHAGTLIRCSPEQLRCVTRDLSSVDREINGPRNFHSLMSQVSQQQKFLDLIEHVPPEVSRTLDEEDTVRFRLNRKRPAHQLFEPPIPDLDEDTVERYPHGTEDSSPGIVPAPHGEAEGRTSRRFQEQESRGDEPGDHRLRESLQEQDIQRSIRRPRVPRMVRETRDARESQSRDAEIHDLPSTTPGGRRSTSPGREGGATRKRKSSKTTSQLHEEEHAGGTRPAPHLPSEGADRDTNECVPGLGTSGPFDGTRDHGRGVDEPQLSTGSGGVTARTDESSGRDAAGDHELHACSTSKRPVRMNLAAAVLQCTSLESSKERSVGQTDSKSLSTSGKKGGKTVADFISYANQMQVVEIEMLVAPRDVHSCKGVWVLNQKVKKNAEVNFRQLNEMDQQEFKKAMSKEVNSYVSSEAALSIAF